MEHLDIGIAILYPEGFSRFSLMDCRCYCVKRICDTDKSIHLKNTPGFYNFMNCLHCRSAHLRISR